MDEFPDFGPGNELTEKDLSPEDESELIELLKSPLVSLPDLDDDNSRSTLIQAIYHSCVDVVGDGSPLFPPEADTINYMQKMQALGQEFRQALSLPDQHARLYLLTPDGEAISYRIRIDETVAAATELLLPTNIERFDGQGMADIKKRVVTLCMKYCRDQFPTPHELVLFAQEGLEKLTVSGIPTRFVLYKEVQASGDIYSAAFEHLE